MVGPGYATILQGPDEFDIVESESWSRRLVGGSRPMLQIIETIRLVAPRRSTVLLTGETGTGKEAIARAIHEASARAHRGFVPVNCAALPENLVESELFGYARGAFTGAVGAKQGYFEKAHGGTLFLDEIGEMPLALQGKLLRALQEREVQPLGSAGSVAVDCRVIAASNVDLRKEAANGRFRQDLFYRLSVVSIHIPPLRERREDIPLLAEHFLRKICRQEELPELRLHPSALRKLQNHHWPGNVREMEHALECAAILAAGKRELTAEDLLLPAMHHPDCGTWPLPDLPPEGLNLEELTRAMQLRLLEQALDRAEGNKSRAAMLLGMKRTTLLYKARLLGFEFA